MRVITVIGMLIWLVWLGSGLGFAQEETGALEKFGFFRIMGGPGLASRTPSISSGMTYATVSLGIGYEHTLGPIWYELDLMYLTKGSKYGHAGPDIDYIYESSDSIGIVSLNALGKIIIIPQPSIYILTGIASGFVISSTRSVIEDMGDAARTYSFTPYTKTDWNIVIGAGVGSQKSSAGIFFESRFYFGLTNILSYCKHNLFLILAGYRF